MGNNSSNTNTITTFHFMHSGKMFASVQNHKILNLIGIVSIAVAFVTSVIFNALAGSGSSDILVSTVGNLSDKYDLSFTPAGFTFSIWSIIYIWLAAAIGFFIYTLFSSSDEGKLYLNPGFLYGTENKLLEHQ